MSEESLPAPLSLGFIGGSLGSAVGYAHFVSALMDNRWSLAAGCFSRDAASNRETARAYDVPAPRVHESWQELVRQERQRLDAVVVLTPTPSHCEIVSACLAAGMPVICEKALALTSAEARRIIAARDAARGFLAVTFNYSGYPMVRELRQLIRAGRLGRIMHFQAEMPQEGFRRVDGQGHRPVPQPWRLADGEIPTLYLDLAVHLHHLVGYLTGEKPIEVVAEQRSYGWFPVVDNVTALCRYSSGVQGQIWFSKSAMGHRNGLRLRIYGTEASAEWFQANPEEVALAHIDGRREVLDRGATVQVAAAKRYTRFKAGHPAGFVEAFANLYVDIADCLRQHRASGAWASEEVFGGELALEGLTMLEAMVASTRTNTWQPVACRP